MSSPSSLLPPMPGPLPAPRSGAPGAAGLLATVRRVGRAVRAHPAEVLAFTAALALCGWCWARPFGPVLAAVLAVGSAEGVLLAFAEHLERPVGRAVSDALHFVAVFWAAVVVGGAAYHRLPAGSWGLPIAPARTEALRFWVAFAAGAFTWSVCAGAWWPAVRPPTVTEVRTEWKRASAWLGLLLGAVAALGSFASDGASLETTAKLALRVAAQGTPAIYGVGIACFVVVGVGVVAGKGAGRAWPRVQHWLGRLGR